MEWVGRSARDLAAAVRAGETSAVEVVRAHLDHADRVDRDLGAFVVTRGRAALEEAAAVDARQDRFALPLAGVPVAINDTVDVAGEATRHGSQATSAAPVERDALPVKRLRAAGAVVLGKTRCPELSLWAMSDDEQATAVSPWDPTRSAGGPSGGAGAAVGAGLVPIALAADGLGAARIPAAACGVVGVKPGGAVGVGEADGGRHWYGSSRFATIATTVGDAALALDVIAGSDQLRSIRAVDRVLRVAVSWRPAAVGVVVTSAWREAAIEAGRLLNREGHEVLHEDPPYELQAIQTALSRWTQGAVAEVAALGLDRDRLQPRTRAHLGSGERLAKLSPVSDEDAVRWRERVLPFFEEHDVLITPTFARAQPAANAWHTKPWVANIAASLSAYPFTSVWNLADLPAIAVPLWEDGGRPLSVQVVAGPGREDLALSVAAELEALVPWTRQAPGWGVPA